MNDTIRPLVLFGHPVAHSLSPRIQQAFAAQFDLAIDYGCIDVEADGFKAAVDRFFVAGGCGANVTVPHKRAAFELADEPSAAAIRARAANVLFRDAQGRLHADNTDGSGLVADLVQRRGLDLAGMRVVLLGAGGAAHGVAGPLLDAGIESLLIANRTEQRAEALAASLGARARATTLASLHALGRADLLIQATSAGHARQGLSLPSSLLTSDTVCCDLSYGPAARPFLDWAWQAGAARAFDGLGMLVETAAASFQLWFGHRPDTAPVFAMLQTWD